MDKDTINSIKGKNNYWPIPPIPYDRKLEARLYPSDLLPEPILRDE